MTTLPSFGLNQYQRTAQLYPAVLAVLPLLAVTLVWAQKVLTLVGNVDSYGGIAALVVLLMQIGRQRGRAVEAKHALGEPVSVVALSHRNTWLPVPTVARYHAAFRLLGFELPTASDEDADPLAAAATYSDAISWLRDQTRDEKRFALVHIENRNYGFCRNLLGLKPIGLALCGAGLALDVALLYLRAPSGTLLGAAWILGVLMLLGLVIWLFFVTPRLVLSVSRGYAAQLLAASDQISKANGGGGRSRRQAAR